MFFIVFSFCVGYTPVFSCVCLAHHHDKSFIFPLHQNYNTPKLPKSFENSYFLYFLKNNSRKAERGSKNYTCECFLRAEWYEVYFDTNCKINAKTTENIFQNSTQIAPQNHPFNPQFLSLQPTHLHPGSPKIPSSPSRFTPNPSLRHPNSPPKPKNHPPNPSFYINK